MRLDGTPSIWGGLGRSLSALATLQELRLAVGVTRGRMMGCYFLMGIIRLSITSSAKRNTLPFRVANRRAGDLLFSVAILLWFNTQGRGAAHLNPGLGKRNSYRVAKGAYRLLWANHSLQQGARHPPWDNHALQQGTRHPLWDNHTLQQGAHLPHWANYSWSLGAYHLRCVINYKCPN